MPPSQTLLAATAAAASSSAPYSGPTATNPSPIAIPKSSLNITSQQRGYYYSDRSNKASSSPSTHPTHPTHPSHTTHIASALVQQPSQTSHAAFSAASLPRTSSLLPPPHLKPAYSSADGIPPSFQNPFHAYATTPASADPVSESDPVLSTRRPSRSSSLGGPYDSAHNLNRWSASTNSSRTSSPARHYKAPAFGRRMSVDTIALQNQLNPTGAPSAYQSPRKLQKSRPTTASGGSPRAAAAGVRVRQQSPAPVPPLASLPPIVHLPSLEQDFRGGSSGVGGRSPSQRPQLFRQPNTDDTGLFLWDDTLPAPPDALASQVNRTDSPMRRSDGADMPNMPSDRNGEGAAPKGHSRNRSQNAKGSADSSKSRGDKSSKQPSQKAMLSRALQKANAAVQLDNAGNVEGARQSYSEACDLLQQVLTRTSGEDDRKKLEAIRKTYTTRIDELDQLGPVKSKDSRPLPRRPESRGRRDRSVSRPRVKDDSDDEGMTSTLMTKAIVGDKETEPRTIPSYSIPISASGTRPTFTPGPPDIPRYGSSSQLTEQYTLQSSFSKSPGKNFNINGLSLVPPTDSQYMPPPLSPRRPPSPSKPTEMESPMDIPIRADFSLTANRLTPESKPTRGHARGNSHESISWLDPINESGSSAASSVHSRSSSMRVRRKHIRGASGDTEAEFDAALDDAIEAAYDDGYEPMDPPEINRYEEDGDAVVANALRRVELAKERVRESEREALALATEREKRLREQLEEMEREEREEYGDPEGFYDGNDSEEEEERILEEMTSGYAIDDFAFGPLKSRPSIPRASDSSEFTSRTWHSSMASNPPTATTVMSNLSTVSENTVVPGLAKGATSTMPPPPSQALPQLPPQPRTMLAEQSPTKDSVRNRRLSGQNPKELKIETSKIGPSTTVPASATTASAAPSNAPTFTTSAHPKTAGFIVQQRQALSAAQNRAASRQGHSPIPGFSPADPPAPESPLRQPAMMDPNSRSGSPSVSKPGLRKNFSSSSLRSMKSRNMSVSAVDDASDMSPGTPLNNQFGANARLPAMPSLPTPIATAFKERMTAGAGTGGLYLFDNDIHSPTSPGSPNILYQDGPAPLEPCPNDSMLRPFWLMRCLYQTLAHPRGGYISNKLFVPRDVWKVKGVKLKNVEEKIANLDFLTAALMKLSKVDNCDADDVLEEMQSLEGIFEQVQSSLTRKLGNEVGVQGSNALFKDASLSPDGDNPNVPRSVSVSGKQSSFSWRRLRSKNSSAGMNSSYASGGRKESIVEGSKEGGLTIPSLPMTSHPTSKPAKRDMSIVQFSGPNANYMAALARMFDAAQTIDQIARQVEDPGLRHADKTQVGLELCTRHAAEFFAFYICRFVLSDLTLLLDKFVKRGSEWVLV